MKRWKFILLERYREEKISLGFLAKELGISISEAMTFVTAYGVASKMGYDDYLKGLSALEDE